MSPRFAQAPLAACQMNGRRTCPLSSLQLAILLLILIRIRQFISSDSSMEGNKHAPQVLIIGAGLGGLMTALLLEHAGISYAVYERAPKVKPLGAVLRAFLHCTTSILKRPCVSTRSLIDGRISFSRRINVFGCKHPACFRTARAV